MRFKKTELQVPRALLLDFGGVVVTSSQPEGWPIAAAVRIEELLGHHPELPERHRIIADLNAGNAAAKQWRNAMSRPLYPAELTHAMYVLDFVASEWPVGVRSVLTHNLHEVCYLINQLSEDRKLRPGIRELLQFTAQQSIPTVIVSNALFGAVHRDYLAAAGLSEFFTAEIYSDEQGIRKPNPELLFRGAAAAGVEPTDCWYVGDHVDRDVLCGTRAGIGVNVLMEDPGKRPRPFTVEVTEDLRVKDPGELLAELKAVMSNV